MPADENFEDDGLIQKLVGSATSLPDQSESETDRFFAGVRNLLEDRAQSGWKGEDGDSKYAVFVLVGFPRKPLANESHNLKRVIDLTVSNESVFGKIFFLAFNAANGTTMELPVEPNDVLDWLTENGLGLCPVAIAYRDTLKISLRETVEAEEFRFKSIREQKPELTIDSLKTALSSFHEEGLVTPTSCGAGVWEPGRSAEYVPAKNTEKAIQQRLRYHLTGWFHGIVKVGMEDTVSKGRIDVRLLAPPASGNGLQYWSIIELKVARTFRNAKNGKPPQKVSEKALIDELLKGIGQAHDFTEETQVKEGFLEVYDMRQDKSEELLEHEKVAAKLGACNVPVNAAVREMFGSSEEAREHSFGAS